MMNIEILPPPAFQPTHAGVMFKRQILKQYKMSVAEASRRLGVSEKYLSSFCNGHVPCTAELAQRLAQETSTNAELWISLQANYDNWQANNQP